MGKILDGIHRTKIKGSSHFSTGINIAALALKHRQNKLQRQRIIVFSCSPIAEDEKALVRLAKRMKKNNISIDVIAFGSPDDDTVKKLTDFNDAVKGADGSYLGVIPPGPNLLSDTILATPLLANEGVGGSSGAAGAAGGGGEGGDVGASQFEFGVNPEVDPELALALRMSYEEEKARQEKERKAKEEDESKQKLEGIPEADEKQPLLSEQAEASAEADAPDAPAAPAADAPREDDDGKKKDASDDKDKMDTA
jgi:26S proteasome regulatory subunit N10